MKAITFANKSYHTRVNHVYNILTKNFHKYFLLAVTMISKATNLKSDLALGSGFKAAHLSPLSTYLVLYLFFSAQVFPRSSGAQKFYPNGRYGRRSDLPPLLSPPLVKASSLASRVDALLSQGKCILFQLYPKKH